jgi:cytidine deaminase
MTDKELLDRAREAAEKAYAPYSGFRVGAALETESGEIVTGCNVENGSYSLTICAERNALFHAVAEGHRRFTRIAIHVDSDRLFPPCGACRQVLAEFADQLPVILGSRRETLHTTLRELLPLTFRLNTPTEE